MAHHEPRLSVSPTCAAAALRGVRCRCCSTWPALRAIVVASVDFRRRTTSRSSSRARFSANFVAAVFLGCSPSAGIARTMPVRAPRTRRRLHLHLRQRLRHHLPRSGRSALPLSPMGMRHGSSFVWQKATATLVFLLSLAPALARPMLLP